LHFLNKIESRGARHALHGREKTDYQPNEVFQLVRRALAVVSTEALRLTDVEPRETYIGAKHSKYNEYMELADYVGFDGNIF
jgi:hypothetical protein